MKFRGIAAIIVLCASMALPGSTWAGSWYTGATGILGTTDKVGIGTSTPGVGLTLKQNDGGSAWFLNNYITTALNGSCYGEVGTSGHSNGTTKLWMGNNLESTPARSPSYYYLPTQSDNRFASWITLWDCANDLFEICRIAPNWGNNKQTLFMINSAGNVGIGKISPQARVDVAAVPSSIGVKVEGAQGSISLPGLVSINNTGDGNAFQVKSAATYHNDRYIADFSNSSGSVMRVNGGGFVGVGKTNPQYRLDVAGTIKATEIKVMTASVDDLTVAGSLAAHEITVDTSRWSDFVFEENYRLPSLDQVESFVKENKHLPDIPSAEHISKNGLSMADMMARQMQKIEELTLYVIELKKENASLNAQVAKMGELEQRIAAMEDKK